MVEESFILPVWNAIAGGKEEAGAEHPRRLPFLFGSSEAVAYA